MAHPCQPAEEDPPTPLARSERTALTEEGARLLDFAAAAVHTHQSE
jgi:hypothetical protein